MTISRLKAKVTKFLCNSWAKRHGTDFILIHNGWDLIAWNDLGRN